MKKRNVLTTVFSILVILALVVPVLTSCSGKSAETAEGTAAPKKQSGGDFSPMLVRHLMILL